MRFLLMGVRRTLTRHAPRTPVSRLSKPLKRGYISSLADSSDADTEPDYNFGSYEVILPQEPYVWGVSHMLPRVVPAHIRRPGYAIEHSESISDLGAKTSESSPPRRRMVPLTGEDNACLRRAARLAADVLKYAGSLVKVGVTTDSIDAKVHQKILSHSAYPSPLLYKGFPKSCCTSINNIITHGIPDERPLRDGDIVNIDITLYKDGYHGDTSRTFLVGDVDHQGRELVEVTERALEAGIAACAPGRPFKAIGKAISEYTRDKKFCISTQFTGHGIGEDFHRPPWIVHHLNDESGVMQPGDCFTIEPCIIQGSEPHGWIFPDGWTTSTENCARSAQAEDMILITESGAEVLTQRSH